MSDTIVLESSDDGTNWVEILTMDLPKNIDSSQNLRENPTDEEVRQNIVLYYSGCHNKWRCM